MKKNILSWLTMAVMALALTACGQNKEARGDHEDAEEHAEGDGHDHDGHGSEKHAGEITMTQAQAKEAELKVETVKAAPFRAALQVSGQILSGQGDEQTVVATSSGIVRFANTSITEGMPVRAGQTVAVISAQNIQDGDPAVKAKAAYEAAKSEYERAKGLVADKIISQREFEQARMQYTTARVAYEAQAKSMTGSGVAVASNMGGYVKSRLVAQGEYVTVGQPIVVITQSRRLQLKADVPSNYASRLSSVRDANFRMAGSSEVHSTGSLHGRVLSYARSVTDGSAFVPVTFEFDNVGDVVSGTYADVWLLSARRQQVISLPISALTEEQGLHYVYVQIEPDAFMKREVAIGQTDGQRVEIVKGLKEGEKVVTHGAYEVKLAATSAAIPAHTHNH